MNLRPLKRFWLPKAGNAAQEYEDAYRACYPCGFKDGRTARMAVSDGASESAFARDWANSLTAAFVTRPLNLDALTEDALREWLAPAQKEWHSRVPWSEIPWHGEAKARAGAFATLLGVTVAAPSEDPARLCWNAMAVGDSCLFIVRDDQLHASFPLEDPSLFDNNPSLICSNPAGTDGLWQRAEHAGGECEAGDLFLLASDALARWLLVENAAGRKPWETLMSLDEDSWPGWVQEQRDGSLMGNDDMTLLATAVV